MSETYVTRRELAGVAEVLDRRLDRLEKTVNRFLMVFGTAIVLILAVEILILRRIGL